MRTTIVRVLLIVVGASALLALLGPAQATGGSGVYILGNGGKLTYLWRCSVPRLEAAKWNCYVRRLLRDIERTKDPARELPRIDRKVRAGGGYLEGNCHMMMHVVGRLYARRNHITLDNLQRSLPRSNDPGCSAGFGMGMVMALGSEIGQLGPGGAVRLCLRAPTRFRSYTCIHTLGHAYMRLYHGQLRYGLRACRALPAQQAPDCAQGAYHDYWLSVAGRDSAKRPHGALRSARVLCGRQIRAFVRPCWYRYFLELPPKHLPRNAAGIRTLCVGLRDVQREGCVAAASLITSADPFTQLEICGALRRADSVSCLYGVNVQNLATSRGSRRVTLIQDCTELTLRSRAACYEWLGTALAVVTNGRFEDLGCPFLRPPGRSPCLAGARRMNDALVTFS